MWFSSLVLACLTTLMITGCDPMRRINMHNRSGEIATIEFHIKEDSLHASPFYLSSSKQQVFEMHPHKSRNLIRLSSGIGNWTPSYLRSVVDDLEAMIITWKNGEIRMEKEEEIYTYLLSRRRGMSKNKILLRITD